MLNGSYIKVGLGLGGRVRDRPGPDSLVGACAPYPAMFDRPNAACRTPCDPSRVPTSTDPMSERVIGPGPRSPVAASTAANDSGWLVSSGAEPDSAATNGALTALAASRSSTARIAKGARFTKHRGRSPRRTLQPQARVLHCTHARRRARAPRLTSHVPPCARRGQFDWDLTGLDVDSVRANVRHDAR